MEGEEIERGGEGKKWRRGITMGKFSGYVAADVQLYKRRNRSSRCLHKVSK